MIWLEDVGNDSRELTLRRWSSKANNREEGASLAKKTKIIEDHADKTLVNK
jgi:hypothetical protein